MTAIISLLLFTFLAFGVLCLACYSLTEVWKVVYLKPRYEDRYGVDEVNDKESRPVPVGRRRYVTAVRTMPNVIGLVAGGMHWLVHLLALAVAPLLPEGAVAIEAVADHLNPWPVGLQPFAEPLLGLAAGGLAIAVHNAVGESLNEATRAFMLRFVSMVTPGGKEPKGDWQYPGSESSRGSTLDAYADGTLTSQDNVSAVEEKP